MTILNITYTYSMAFFFLKTDSHYVALASLQVYIDQSGFEFTRDPPASTSLVRRSKMCRSLSSLPLHIILCRPQVARLNTKLRIKAKIRIVECLLHNLQYSSPCSVNLTVPMVYCPDVFFSFLVFQDRVSLQLWSLTWNQLLQTRMASNSQRSACRCLLSAGIKDVRHHRPA